MKIFIFILIFLPAIAEDKAAKEIMNAFFIKQKEAIAIAVKKLEMKIEDLVMSGDEQELKEVEGYIAKLKAEQKNILENYTSVVRTKTLNLKNRIKIYRYYISLENKEVRHGQETIWYKNGKQATKTIYKHGRKDGESKQWYEDGTLAAIHIHNDGIKNGKWKIWHRNGELARIEIYNNDKKDGKWESWHENGQLAVTSTYNKNTKIGEWKYWYENSKLARTQ